MICHFLIDFYKKLFMRGKNEKKRKMKKTLIYILIALSVALCGSLFIYFIVREIKAVRTPVEITVEITGTHYKEPYTTVQYNPTLKTNMIVTHDAEYKTYFKYEIFTITSDLSSVYDYCYGRKGDKIRIKAIKVEYTDGEVKYVFNKIIN